jgi:eukaryotic-like serine/threonine-protein kinase
MDDGGTTSSSRSGATKLNKPALPRDDRAALPRADVLAPGTTVGDYAVQGTLGEGGMGTVYSAIHPLIGKKAAIKVISAALCQEPEAVDRFVQEARAVNQIGHPNIVDVFAFGRLDDGRSYLIMEWLQGQSLADRLDSGPIALDDALRILAQVADALEAAHEAKIVHRDLKPDNVFLVAVRGQRDLVKLLDFGIAKLTRTDGALAATATGLMMGTPGYMSPEQARGKDVDYRTDLYALGVMAYLLVLGQPPFAADNAMDLIVRHMYEPVPAPRTIWPQVPEALERLIVGLLHKDAQARPGTVEVRAVLAAVHAELAAAGMAVASSPLASITTPPGFASQPRPSGLAPAGPGLTSAAAQGVPLATSEVPAGSRRRLAIAAGLGAALVVAGVAAVIGLGSSANSQPSGGPSAAAPVPSEVPPGPTEPTPAPAPAAPVGAIVVDTNVASARFELDGEVMPGTGPSLMIPVDQPGDHELVVRAQGYRADRRSVRVAAGATVRVGIDLIPLIPVVEPGAASAVRRAQKRPGSRRSTGSGEGTNSAGKDTPLRGKKGSDAYTLDPFAQ